MIYLSPATSDESQVDPSTHSISRQVLLDPELNGFFYRSDLTVIEQWQLWDDDDVKGVRPRPPASPFGQNQGLYHDDLTDEIQHYLRQMDMEEHSSSCNESTSSRENRRRHHRRRSRSKTRHHPDTLNRSFSQSHTGSFDPTLIPVTNNLSFTKPPIIIEKVLPNSMLTPRPVYPFEQHSPLPIDDPEPYHVREHCEKISRISNRILSMDVIQPSNNDQTRKSHRKRSKHIPVLDLRSMENLLKETEHHRHTATHRSAAHDDDRAEIVEGYFEDSRGRKLKLNGTDAQTMLEHFETSHRPHRHRTPSTFTAGPDINYVERSSSQLPSMNSPPPPPPIEHEENVQAPAEPFDTPDFISPFRYMQSSVNPSLFREYRHLFFNTVQ